ncbi:hypothetical protein LIER_10378 [Lithospermum erythrorhizon]|uniref:RNase H type-1 domain-containing protein n=1 Tax=Lithospermum erythrorhizon TaxID=34254 RepID=A0AAV3PKV9_LITER
MLVIFDTIRSVINNGASLAVDFTRTMGNGAELAFLGSLRKPLSIDGSLGIVCRDALGVFRGACFMQQLWVTSPLVAEAHAIREGLHFAWKCNYRRIEIESDSK